MARERNSVTLGKLAVLFLGILVLGVGLDSHFNSTWNEKVEMEDGSSMRVYEICNNATFKEFIKVLGKPCPPISMEIYFICALIVSVFITLVTIPLGIKFNLGNPPLKFVDAGVHGLCAIMLLAAGIVYVISAVQIERLFKAIDMDLLSISFKYAEKIASGAAVMAISLLYGLVAFLIVAGRDNSRNRY